MIGNDLLKIIKDNKLESFKMEVLLENKENTEGFLDLTVIKVLELNDIGVSSQVAYLKGFIDEFYDYSEKTITGNDLIKVISKNNLEEFEIKVLFHNGKYINGYEDMNYLKLETLEDIGYSDKVFLIGSELE